MCAIAGVIGIPCGEDILQRMLTTMQNRGPDGNGVVKTGKATLLHSRLAIIDPAGGKQPMQLSYGGETYTLVYNGELYNTQEIRAELIALGHTFLEHSDTEVLLHAYAQWAEDCLQKLNGIFAFGVWEQKRQRLFLARDRMGVKPLFYTCVQDGLIFASEIKTVLAHGARTARLDEDGVAQLLLLGPGRSPGSGVFRNIYEIKPGWFGTYEKGRLGLHRYWRLTDGAHEESFAQTAEHVRFLVTDAIKRQMVSDVPLGTFLSGGLDSSLISAVCAGEMAEPLPTFSVDYENNEKYFVPGKFQPNSDSHYIHIMQDHLRSDHQWTVLTPEMLNAVLEEATCARDLPGMGDVDFSLLAFCKQIRQKVKVALSGECADEIFGGYPWYRDPQVRAVDGFPWAQNTHLRASFLAPEWQSRICPEEFVNEQYRSTLDDCHILPECSPAERRMKELVNLNMQWFMQTLLDRKDRMSMACGLEVRVPFCDHRIAQYLYTVPWEYKDYQGREKGLLRYALGDLLPERVRDRKKSPYPKTWDPHYRELMAGRLEALLEQKDAPLMQIVDRKALKALLTSDYPWPWYGQLMRTPQLMAYMLQMDYWLRQYHVEPV